MHINVNNGFIHKIVVLTDCGHCENKTLSVHKRLKESFETREKIPLQNHVRFEIICVDLGVCNTNDYEEMTEDGQSGVPEKDEDSRQTTRSLV